MNAMQSCGCGCGGHSCGCCAGVEPLTPLPTANRPGLAALEYRVGTHGTFLETMKARLSLHELPGGIAFDGSAKPPSRPLAALRTRDPADFSIALLDSWAVVGDVLTFYQERIANEGYLRTAMEMRSVYEMARLVGYRPRPGVAASVYLAYTIDGNVPEEVLIQKGARAQTVPGPGEFPQSFETSEPLRARARWNELKLRTTQPQSFETVRDNSRVFFKGVTTNVNPGDPLLVADPRFTPLVARAMEVIVDRDNDRTEIKLAPWGGTAPAGLERLRDVLGRAPPGQVASRIVLGIESVMLHASSATAGDALPRAMVKSADDAIQAELGAVHLPAEKLRNWAGEVRRELRRAVHDAAALDEQAANLPVASLVSRLARAGSKPRANAAELPRSLAADFGATSDAGLRLLGAVAPSLRDSIGPAIAGQTDENAAQSLEVFAFRVRAGVFGRNAPKRTRLVGQPVEVQVIGEWPIVETSREQVIGINAAAAAGKNPVTAIHEAQRTIYLDAGYEGIVPGSWAFIDLSGVVVDPASSKPHPLVLPADARNIARIAGVHKSSRAEYGIAGDTVRLDLASDWLKIDAAIGKPLGEHELQDDIDRDFRVVRATTVFARSEKLALALEPIEAEFCGASDEEQPAELDGLYQDLEPGRFVIVSGERADLGDGAVVRASEALMLRAVRHDVRVADKPVPWADELARNSGGEGDQLPAKLADDRPHTFVWFDKPLSYCYRRNTVSIRANVVKATHGETRTETLGNGDGAKALLSFAPKQFPLTYTAAATTTGTASSLEVFVNDTRWHERESFVLSAPTDRIFVTKGDEQGKVSVIFGNGIEGARVPTGVENVKSVYRFGIGKPGNVRAGQISQLSTRPLGVKDVVNPLRASGGADLESRDQARRNAPNAVQALDRLVSTRDYADFSRAFAGIGKAAALELPSTGGSVIHVTIAGSDDIPIDTTSDLFIGLRHALRRFGDPFQPVQLATRELLILVAAARVRILPDYRWEVVVAQLRAKLLDAFGFERRELALGVAASELLAVMQSVRGVAYVDLDSFGAVAASIADASAEGGLRPRTPEEIAAGVQAIVARTPPDSIVPAARARPAPGGVDILPAQLAVLLPDAPDTLVLNQIE